MKKIFLVSLLSKTLISLLIIVFALVIMLPYTMSTAFAGTFGDYDYTVNLDGVSVTITGYHGAGGDITIPDEIDGKTVTAIGDRAFKEIGENKLISVVMPNSITSMETQSFYNCKNLTNIILSQNLESIKYYSFFNCNSLNSIDIPDSVISIGEHAFTLCISLESISLSKYIQSIGEDAFYICSSLKSITVDEENTSFKSIEGVLFNKAGNELIKYPTGNTRTEYLIPDGVILIDKGAFYECDYLESVTVPDGITTIQYRTFSHCGALESINIPFSVTSIGGEAFDGCGNLENISIPSSVVSIGSCGFSGCNSLIDVILPGSITSIGEKAFEGCRHLTSITISNSVTSIGTEAFANCFDLKDIIVEEGNLHFKSIDGVLFNYSGTSLLQYPPGKSGQSYTVPVGVTSLSKSAFKICRNLRSILLPDGLIKIGEHAFFQCGIEGISLPDSVTDMVGYAFYDCASIKAINIDESNTKFKSIDGVLYDKAGTKLLQYPKGNPNPNYVIPDGVTEIGFHSFYSFNGVRLLKNLYIPESVIIINSDTFNVSTFYPGDITIYGEAGSYAESFADSKGLDFIAGEFVLVSGVELDKETILLRSGETATLNATVYPGNALVKDITWSSSDSSIASVQNGVITAHTHTGNAIITVATRDGGFTDACEVRVEPEQCTVHFYTNGSYIRQATVVFGGSIPEPVLPFKNGYCFAGWYPTSECNTTPISFPFTPTEEETNIYAKWETPDVTSTFGDYDYWIKNGEATITGYNGSGDSITIPSTVNGYPVTAIGSYTFKNNNDVTYITIPDGVISIGEQTFFSCTNLKSISIPDSVNRIGWNSFASCTSLKSIILPSNLTMIDYGIFYYCSSLSSVTIPDSVTSIEGSAFYHCAIESITFPQNVNYLGGSAFAQCTSLCRAYFKGDAPYVGTPTLGTGGEDLDVFDWCGSDFTVCYLAGADGFTDPWHDYPTMVYDPNVLFESGVFCINRTHGHLEGVSMGTSISELKEGFSNSTAIIKIFDTQDKAYFGDVVATGLTVKLYIEGLVKDELTIIILGDANGDGSISITDYTLARLDILDLKPLTGAYEAAADINGDGIISITDYTLIRLDILGLKKIH